MNGEFKVKSIINRNGFEITVNDRVVKWMRKADKLGKLNNSMYHITRRIEEYGIVSTYKAKSEFCYPAICKASN